MAVRLLRRVWLCLLLVPANGALAGDLAAVQPAPDLTIHYDLYTGGLHTVGIEAKAHIQAERYALTADVNSVGLINWFFRYHARHEAGGKLTEGGIRPELYANAGEWNGGGRSVTLSYGDAGPIEAEVRPTPEKDERDPVPAHLWIGTVDPLSLVLAVNRRTASEEPCAVTVPVFDGRRRYNLHLEPVGLDRLPANRYSSFAGAALKCRVIYERVAGDPRNPQWQLRKPPQTTVWLARFGRNRIWLPVRLETESIFGAVVGHITHVAAAGTPHPLD
ncbi:MAG: DUF3108 domain-containing protein [Proteobacteria bacterium]|nr:DUF3108 domain-containing protein [Pseudomonadota bacterium]